MKCERPIDVSIKSGGDKIHLTVGYYNDGSGSDNSWHRKRRVYQGRKSFLVPCGKCLACKSRRKSQATFRMDCERRFGHIVKHKDGTSSVVRHRNSFFITLTYADEFVPYSWEYCDRRTGECFTLLEKQDKPVLFPLHLQNFFKRLRRYYDSPCSYFAVGEYGDIANTYRPHFHIILYTDMDWKDCKDACRHCWSMECPKSRIGSSGTFPVNGKYDTWRLSFGRVDVKAVNMRRIRYCAKYVVKDNNDSDVVPKFARLSKGLGSGFFESSQARDVRQSKKLYAFSVDGKKCSLGRYYSHRLFTKSELQDLVDDFLEKEDFPEGIEGSPDYQHWYDEKMLDESLRYQTWKLKVKSPLFAVF